MWLVKRVELVASVCKLVSEAAVHIFIWGGIGEDLWGLPLTNQ